MNMNELFIEHGRKTAGYPMTLREILISHEFLWKKYELFENYTKEIDREGSYTLTDLINSHRFLRKQNFDDLALRKKIIEEEKTKLINNMKEKGFILKDDLKYKTIEEIWNIIL